ncbi:hypothetical protein O3M35_002903 [Rhynocoris fuscipes]|uniref:Uncharacterized protein n=1 Tax=Rhynocoris fuscipes TaxID=488301 RepID=A0AAW1CNJ8_9HEMI
MKILYAFLFIGICQMAYSYPEDEEIPIEKSDEEEVANTLLTKLQETDPNLVNKVPQLKQIIEEIVNSLSTDDEEDDSKYLDELKEKPWLANQIIMRSRWKKIRNKIKKAGKKVLGSAAASLAGKAIAGAIAG